MAKKQAKDNPQIPRDLCEHCGKPVGMDDWVINGDGELVHYTKCFDARRSFAAERSEALAKLQRLGQEFDASLSEKED